MKTEVGVIRNTFIEYLARIHLFPVAVRFLWCKFYQLPEHDLSFLVNEMEAMARNGTSRLFQNMFTYTRGIEKFG
jgi:hypothetical protein